MLISAETAVLKVEGVSAHYDGVQALWRVSLEVEQGAVVALIGGNGAGKTTLLRTISRLLPVSQGSITLFGRDLVNAGSHDVVAAGIAHVPEARQLFPMMTVRENLELGAYLPQPRRHVTETLAHVFELFPILAERRRQLANTLSGGEQQMLAIGRGLMLRPRLLMLDEPSLGLAPLIVESLLEIIRRVNHNGVTVLLVEQNVRHALEIAKTAYVLENGRIVLHGPAAELADNAHIRRAYLGL
jgi:branched-chain amino acid transport system ATP-binding protein